ncbi:MerR family transcriptional regulator [Acutalibacter sp. LFL-21]|uniref:MerR family transcriptional regulator n=1 Tax=Acutalibacter sp. LFL-21 TaxID=2983399 RepID=UPI00294FFE85|nr:MerR family transcriptional regulator [Acutalibacter sp. LFL-21]
MAAVRTVKEISDLTGISVRALHYYDEIGLLKPTAKSSAGYRLYDDKSLEILQQILFFRELDFPLKEIKDMLGKSSLETDRVLQMQRALLIAKKERLERLIAHIDRILTGGQTMNFEAFSKAELKKLYQTMIENMTAEQKAEFLERYGNVETGREKFLEKAETEAAQQNFQKVVEWYGGEEKAMNASKNAKGAESIQDYQKQLDEIMRKLAEKKEESVDSPEVTVLMEEYDSVVKEMFQMDDASRIMLDMAASYRSNPEIQAVQDEMYGEGVTVFLAKVMEAFYRNR